MKRVAIFGGSFNPPHRGHAALAKAAALGHDELWVMPSGDRSDKAPGLREERRALAEAFARDLAAELDVPVRLETLELELPPPIWTYRTLQALRERYPGHRFGFVVSSELLPDIRATWEDGEALWREADFLVATRPGHELVGELPPSAVAIRIENPLELSSTAVRRRAAAGEPVDEHLTPEVAALVAALGLYREAPEAGAV